MNNDSRFSVGINENSETVLRIYVSGGVTTSMTLSQEGVKQMIKLLTATLYEDVEELIVV
jgi:hypothetical protein